MKRSILSGVLFASMLCLTQASFTSCSSNSNGIEQLSSSYYSVKCGSSIELESKGSLDIDDEFYATYSDGKITGKHVGTTYAKYNGAQTIEINVTPSVSYIDHPCVDWGVSKSQVKNAHKSGELAKETDTSLVYYVYSGAKIKYGYVYAFSNGKLTGCIIAVPSSDATRLVNWLSERYIMFMTGDDTLFTGGYDNANTKKAKTVLGISTTSANTTTWYSRYYYEVLFIDINYSSSTKSVDTQNVLSPTDMFE